MSKEKIQPKDKEELVNIIQKECEKEEKEEKEYKRSENLNSSISNKLILRHNKSSKI